MSMGKSIYILQKDWIKKEVQGKECAILISLSTNTKMHLVHETEMVDEDIDLDSVSSVLDQLEVEDKSNWVSPLTF